jgi:hypothetical protein
MSKICSGVENFVSIVAFESRFAETLKTLVSCAPERSRRYRDRRKGGSLAYNTIHHGIAADLLPILGN